MSVEIRKVESKADYKPFFEFPWTVYKDDPNWVPPLLLMRHEQFDRKRGPAWEYTDGDYFTAWRGEKLVGTIAAFINHRHNDFHKEKTGWFGAFEVFDDQEAAGTLLNTAIEWVSGRGCNLIRGPQTFTTHEETGVLVENFTKPVLLMPYHPQYYARLIEAAGFEKRMDMHSYYLDHKILAENNIRERVKKLSDRQMKRESITIRPVTNKNVKESFRLFKDIYNKAWEKNWGFTPMTDREMNSLIETLSIFLDKRLVFVADVKGDPAGIILPVPDVNQLFSYAQPNPRVPEIITLLRVLWGWKVKPVIDGVRIPLIGIKEEYRLKGVPVVLLYHALEGFLTEPRYRWVDAGWILEHNRDMIGIMEMFGLWRYKTHRLYEKSL